MQKVVRLLYFCAVVLGVFLADFFSKQYIEQSFSTTQYAKVLFDIFGVRLSITHATNTGAAWGIFQDHSSILVGLRIVLILFLLGYIAFYNKNKKYLTPFALIISGAIGNVVDFFRYGYVVDMIGINFFGYDYPVFNIADSAICIGSIWLVVLIFFESQNAESS